MTMLSVTMLSGYLYCARKLYLERVLGLREPQKEATVLGTIRHELHDRVNKAEESIVDSIYAQLPLADVTDLYKKKYLGILREVIKRRKDELDEFNITETDAFKRNLHHISEEAELRAANVFAFMEKNRVFGRELWERLTPKIQSELKIESDLLGLKGIIDKVEVYDGFVVPLELKTGKSPAEGAWPGHKIQIAAYMLLLKGTGKTVRQGKIIYLDSKKTVIITENPMLEHEIVLLVSKVNEVLDSKQLPGPCGNENKCMSCGLKGQCYDPDFIRNRLNEIKKANK